MLSNTMLVKYTYIAIGIRKIMAVYAWFWNFSTKLQVNISEVVANFTSKTFTCH